MENTEFLSLQAAANTHVFLLCKEEMVRASVIREYELWENKELFSMYQMPGTI